MQERSITLYFRDARSDKVYQAQLCARDGGFVVNFQYGRRAGTLTSGTKTAKPLPYEKAQALFNKLVAEKQAKGYSEGESGARYQSASYVERFTGIEPQLLNPVTVQALQPLLRDPEWVAQEKFDGERRLVGTRFVQETLEVFGVNRKGLEVALPEALARVLGESLAALAPFTLDGEQVGEVFVLFDVLELSGTSLREQPLAARLAAMARVAEVLAGQPAGGQSVRVADTARTTEAKQALFARIKAQAGEGVVMKRLDAPYVAGRPASGGTQLKHKFVHSATLIVSAQNPGVRSVAVAALAPDGTELGLGNVSIPANAAIPAPGALVEVQYLYAFRGGSLFQPVYKGERTDLERNAATLAQIRYRGEGDADEEDAAQTALAA